MAFGNHGTSVFVRNCVAIFVLVNSLASGEVSHMSRSYFDEISTLNKVRQGDGFPSNKDGEFSLSENYVFNEILNSLEHFVDSHLTNENFRYENGMMTTSKLKEDRFNPSRVLDMLQDTAKNETVSPECVNATGRFILGLMFRESWVLPFLDATAKPGPSLLRGWLTFVGNYDQCRSAAAPPSAPNKTDGFGGNYCVLPVPLNPLISGQYGLCVPNACSSKEVTEIVRDILNVANISLQIPEAQCLTGETEVTTATVFAIIIVSIVGSLALVGTIYDYIFLQNDKMSLPSSTTKEHLEVNVASNDHSATDSFKASNGVDERSESFPKHANGESVPLIPKLKVQNQNESVVVKILLAFSVYTNGKKLLDTSQSSGSLGSIHGIRFLSMSWVLMGHSFLFGKSQAVNYGYQIRVNLGHWTFDVLSNAFLSVDTFFTLSGLLTAYLAIQEIKKRGLAINWPLFYFHRFWRLTPPYMFALVIILGFQQYLGQGPFWSNEQPNDKQFCEESWWTNLLYVNNLVNTDKACFGHSWYLANDMQFFVISPLLFIPFYFHWLAGVGSCSVVLLASWITTGVLSSQHNWGPSIFTDFAKHNNWFDGYYITPWCRIGPYIMGILAGYILSVTKGRQFRMPRWVVVVGWTVATASALAVLYGIHGDLSGEHLSSQGALNLYNTVGRSVWGACVCWVIVACSAGYGGPVNALLSWSPFVFLGRLTYMTYLIHLNIIFAYFQNFGSGFYFNNTTMAIMFLGLLCFANMASFVFGLFLESPMIGLEKAFLRKKRRD